LASGQNEVRLRPLLLDARRTTTPYGARPRSGRFWRGRL